MMPSRRWITTNNFHFKKTKQGINVSQPQTPIKNINKTQRGNKHNSNTWKSQRPMGPMTPQTLKFNFHQTPSKPIWNQQEPISRLLANTKHINIHNEKWKNKIVASHDVGPCRTQPNAVETRHAKLLENLHQDHHFTGTWRNQTKIHENAPLTWHPMTLHKPDVQRWPGIMNTNVESLKTRLTPYKHQNHKKRKAHQ